MSNTYYTSLSGMLAASYGLQNTSNNVANMQSPGFKRNDVFYSSLGNSNGDQGLGSGVCIGGNKTNFSAGTHLPTENPSDLAIVGQGFFVVKFKNGELLYTRDGEFEFDNDGVLVDRHSGGQVQGYDKAGNLVPIHEKGPKTSEGKASHDIFLKGQFVLKEKTEAEKNEENTGDPTPNKSKYKNIKIPKVIIYDDQGKAHEISLEFKATPNTPSDNGTSWDLIKISYEGKEISTFGNNPIIFTAQDQGPNSLNNTIQFNFNDQQSIRLHFGTNKEDSNSSVQLKESKLNPEGTQVEAFQNDGYGEGKQISFSFDENGQISYHYDNNQTITGIHVGLARFDDVEHTLVQSKDNLFRAKSDKGIHLGRANQDGFGSIKAKFIENSNVNSTTEFANIVILQRMFQACSQIMDIDKQLLEGLAGK